ncbi:TetR/AcrR family transcriptional regulator [Corynebacterium lowii]|uniref:HTH-type transcriptional regulator BetI n=1 Tax=Corynebacterium lowii TaxID=1544413 RepID=A0A0Q0U299_9CORY|nr:TetR/AcrR family transcriptional regulator [Corynebacterium lowii]KQB85973.1 HTH-type transcriptional regulator BetI [Corynebacterium lowii]MDP9850597.1 AcrR family transcriptional regulator [Corynebacterium lowii]
MASLRETKKAATRDSLAEAAAILVLTQGAEGLTVARIAETAGVSPRTFHNYFSSREEALFHSILQRITSVLAEVEAIAGDLPLLDAIEKTAVEGLYRDNDASSSIFVLFRLCEVAEVLIGGDKQIKDSLRKELESFNARLQALYPELDEFEINIISGAAAHAIGTALIETYQRGELDPAKVEPKVRRGFAVLRSLS